jgi:hypothetical protein
LWARDPRPITEVFELVRRAGRRTLRAEEGMGKLWRQDPPTPLSLPWDAPEDGGGAMEAEIAKPTTRPR